MALTRQETSSSQNDEEVFELAPPPSTHVLEQLQTFLRRDFCKPICENTAALRSGDGVQYDDTLDGLERPIIHVHPFDNLKKVLNGFCDPEELLMKRVRFSRSLMTESYDSEDTKDDSSEEEDDDETPWGVLVTHPGTSRAPRIYQGLETFVFAMIILFSRLHILRQCGLDFELELRSKDGDDGTSPFSYYPKPTRWAH